jgi:cyclin E
LSSSSEDEAAVEVKKSEEGSKINADIQRDSDSQRTNVYSSSSSKKIKQQPSPAESSSTIGTSEVSDFDVASYKFDDDLVLGDYNVFSPLENENIVMQSDERKVLASKNEKTPHSQKKRASLSYKTKIEDKVPCYVTPTSEQRLCPLPQLPWADRKEVWKSMVNKDEKASLDRDVNMFDEHPCLQPRMRAILLDWLIEVCEVYKLHRETYYLTVDYLDRYLTIKKNISKNHLQLIGITCLFIASKVK